MSLNSFKESLKVPLSPSSTASYSTLPSQSQNSIRLSQQEFAVSPRKPPKSSIFRQLQRCSGSLDFSSGDVCPRIPHRRTLVEDGNSEAVEEKKTFSFPGVEFQDSLAMDPGKARIVSDVFSGAVGGPFEPLTLSSPGEFPLIQVPERINCRLLEHQREGVKFLYGLYKKNHGGVLGDDMGLGKTIQTIALLVAVAAKNSENSENQDDRESGGPFLIVCPTSVIRNWENEFNEWSDLNVAVYHGSSRDLILNKLESRGFDALITSFDTFRIHGEILSRIKWDIVIFDEAHRLKNESSQLYKACSQIKTRRRFGLTGTVMQNKIMELFNLFDFLSPGSLGTREHFRDFYDEPLKHGQRMSAPERFIEISKERRQLLSSVLQKYLLRRTKEETISHLMIGKEDNVAFCAMSDLQRRVYRRMLAQPEIQCLINKDLPCSCGSPLTQVECCHRLIPHGVIWSYLHKDRAEGCESCPFCVVLPCLVKLQQISNHLELIKPNSKDEVEKQEKDAELAAAIFGPDLHLVGGRAHTKSFMGLSDMEHCGKMRALDKLLSSWISSGDKVLLFSYSVRMLDILEKFLIRRGYCFSRLDGSTPMSLRQSQVDDFNRSPSRQVFLISTRAGGLGLNLVSANRVVIFDPNWNPSQDLQAQDRSFRFGQKRHVVVFRLLSAGSLEELIYTRQVYKQQLSNIAVSGKMEKRYFEGVQDCKEFKGELFGICNLFRDLSDKLFTSEIIEPFEVSSKGGRETFHIIEKTSVEKSNLEKSRGTEMEYSPPTHLDLLDIERAGGLHNLGIVYAHRNEDIVNSGRFKISDKNPMKDDICWREKPSHVRKYSRTGCELVSVKRGEASDENECEEGACCGDKFMGGRESEMTKFAVMAKRREDIANENPREKGACWREKPTRERKDGRSEFDLIAKKRGELSEKILVEETAQRTEKISGGRNSKRAEYELIAARRGMGVEEFSRWVLAASPSERQEVLMECYPKMKKKKKSEVGPSR